MAVDVQNHKAVCFGGPAIASSAATSSSYVDTRGWDYAAIDVVINPAATTSASAKWLSLELGESADTNISNATAISGCTGTTNATATATQFVLPVHNDAVYGGIIRFYVDCRTKERYLHVTKKCPDASHLTTFNYATLTRGDVAPNTTTEAGVQAYVFV